MASLTIWRRRTMTTRPCSRRGRGACCVSSSYYSFEILRLQQLSQIFFIILKALFFSHFHTNKLLHNIASKYCLDLADFVSPAIGNTDLSILFLVILQTSQNYSGTKKNRKMRIASENALKQLILMLLERKHQSDEHNFEDEHKHKQHIDDDYDDRWWCILACLPRSCSNFPHCSLHTTSHTLSKGGKEQRTHVFKITELSAIGIVHHEC